MELKTITKMYLMDSKIKCVSVFILLLLLSSCRKNKDISEFVVDPSYETKVEYIRDTIKITNIDLAVPTRKEDVSIWVKKKGKYYIGNFLTMSTEKDTSYVFPTVKMSTPIKEVSFTCKIGENLYSTKTYLELAPHHWEMRYAVYYDKSYRIIKFQEMLACDFILKK
jgi:hypothetical protein